MKENVKDHYINYVAMMKKQLKKLLFGQILIVKKKTV